MNCKEHLNCGKAAVLVDSGCDIAQECIDKYGLWLLPLHIDYPEKAYLDGVDIDPQMVYDRYPKDYPKTSTPSLQEVLDKLEEMADAGIEKVIAVCISSGLSGTCNTIRLAAEDYDKMQIFVFDTKNVSVGSGVFAIWAAWKVSRGASYEEVCRGLVDKIYDSKVMFYMDTLKYLQRGGRIGGVASAVGTALKLKPIISCDREGIYYTVAMIRGAKQGKKKLLDEVLKFIGDCKHCWIIIGHGHGDALEEAKAMEQMLMEKVRGKRILYIKQITATMAVNTGPGLVGVLAFKEP